MFGCQLSLNVSNGFLINNLMILTFNAEKNKRYEEVELSHMIGNNYQHSTFSNI